MRMKTLRKVKTIGKFNIWFNNTWDEFMVSPVGFTAKETEDDKNMKTYFTDDIEDAVDTARAMTAHEGGR